MRFLFLEPFFGGSHKDVAEGLMAHSRHEFCIETLPARFWKWRMRGAALYFIEKIKDLSAYDGLLVSDLMSLSDFVALAGPQCPPALVYFHESQLSYPLAPGDSVDFQSGFTDISTALAARRVVFNSHTHREAFFKRLPAFLDMMPEYRPMWVVEAIRAKSEVVYPGCSFPAGPMELDPPDLSPPLVIWNHRWEFDKNPRDFFCALAAAAARGLDFSLALLGENSQVQPKEFLAARERYKDRIIRFGYVESRAEYMALLKRGAVAVSTAIAENFGLSVVEAVRCGCLPLLPRRLSYPEILPARFHDRFLYSNQEDLVEKLCGLLSGHPDRQGDRRALSESMECHAWENRVRDFDAALENMVCPLRAKQGCRQESP